MPNPQVAATVVADTSAPGMCRAVYWALGIGAVKVVAYAHDERGHVNLFKIEAAERAGDAGIVADAQSAWADRLNECEHL